MPNRCMSTRKGTHGGTTGMTEVLGITCAEKITL
uniref:Uncharacterized protein n=1 Tax=Rhizophora mucronata TaxID=61149 RepID=A0A2P2QXJ9_RHIMU